MPNEIEPYQNKDGYCSLYAVANAIEAALGIRPTEQDIQDFFKKYDTGPKGMRVIEVLAILKREPWLGVKVASFRHPWNMRATDGHSLVSELRNAMRHPDYQIVFSFWGRGDKKWLKLDEENYYHPDKSIPKNANRSHAVFLQKIHTLPRLRRSFTAATFLNNWGANWGDDGYFNMDWDDIESECMHITAIKFTYAPEV